jgi:hypothetical protein
MMLVVGSRAGCGDGDRAQLVREGLAPGVGAEPLDELVLHLLHEVPVVGELIAGRLAEAGAKLVERGVVEGLLVALLLPRVGRPGQCRGAGVLLVELVVRGVDLLALGDVEVRLVAVLLHVLDDLEALRHEGVFLGRLLFGEVFLALLFVELQLAGARLRVAIRKLGEGRAAVVSHACWGLPGRA